NPKIAVGDQVRERLFPRRLLGEDQPDHRAILLELACRFGVVDPQEDFRACGNLFDRARIPDRRHSARAESAEHRTETVLAAAIELVAAAAVWQLAAVVEDQRLRPQS